MTLKLATKCLSRSMRWYWRHAGCSPTVIDAILLKKFNLIRVISPCWSDKPLRPGSTKLGQDINCFDQHSLELWNEDKKRDRAFANGEAKFKQLTVN